MLLQEGGGQWHLPAFATSASAGVVVLNNPPASQQHTLQPNVVAYDQDDIDEWEDLLPGWDFELKRALFDGQGEWIGCDLGGTDCLWGTAP